MVIITFFFVAASYWGGRGLVENQRYAVSLLSHRVSDYIHLAERDLNLLAAVPPDERSLALVAQPPSYFDVIFRIAVSGRLEAIYPPDPQYPVGRDMSSQPYFSPNLREMTISRPFISPRTGNPTLYLTNPSLDHAFLYVGELSLAGLQESLTETNIAPTGIFYLVDQDGYLLVHPQYELVRQRVDIRHLGILPRAAAGQTTQIYFADGNLQLGILMPVQEVGFWAVVQAPLTAIYGPFLLPSLLGLVVVALLFVFVVWREQFALSKSIIRPLQELQQGAQRLANGDFSPNFMPLSDMEMYEEVYGLAMSFAAMRLAIHSRETELSQERNLLRTLIDHLPDLIYTKDLQGRKTLSNPVDVRFSGYTQEDDVLGKTDAEVFPPDVAAQFVMMDRQVLEEGKSLLAYEQELHDREGNPLWLSTSKLPLRDASGHLIGLVGIGHNITESKLAAVKIQQLNAELERRVIERTAQLEAANKELEAFSYSVSHDLRAPLRAIHGYANIIHEDYAAALDPAATNYFRRIQENAQKMSDLINDLLTFSRLGRKQIQQETLSLTDMAREVYNELRDGNRTARLIEFDLHDLPVVVGDHAMLRQVFANLLDNAIKYTRYRSPAKIEVGMMAMDRHDVIYVKDNGAGFDMRYVDKLFGVFQRLHAEGEFEGTGIGLALAYRIILRHGGRIWAEAAVDQGATFYFYLGSGSELQDRLAAGSD